jgi:hypothetical protein
MFEFDKRDEGFLAVRKSDGRAVAHVDAVAVTVHSDPRFKAPETVRTPLPLERWLVHFTAARLTVAEVAALGEELRALTDE